MLDIPGIKWVIHVSAITHHAIILCQFHKTGEWISQPLKCTRAVTWPILYFEVTQITVSHTNIIHAHLSFRNAALPVRPHQTIHVYTHLWWWGNGGILIVFFILKCVLLFPNISVCIKKFNVFPEKSLSFFLSLSFSFYSHIIGGAGVVV